MYPSVHPSITHVCMYAGYAWMLCACVPGGVCVSTSLTDADQTSNLTNSLSQNQKLAAMSKFAQLAAFLASQLALPG